MSLDVYLYSDQPVENNGSGIFVRTNGATVQITREQWDEMNPGREPVVFEGDEDGCVFSANVTHNLSSMASAAGLYMALWRPEEISATKASDLIPLLREGIEKLESDPEKFKKLNPANGWGNYEQLLNFSIGYLGACENWPDAAVKASR